MAIDWAKARQVLPVATYSSTEWAQHWREHGDTFTQMLGDVYRVYKSEEAKRNGTANSKGGRRRASIDGNVEELFSILTPRLTEEPFPASLQALMGQTSQRKLAQTSGIQQATISRWLSGNSRGRPPERYDYERLAKALDVHPAYFVEWRIEVLTELLREVLVAKPALSLSLLKAVSLKAA